jgi:hypothetical protein
MRESAVNKRSGLAERNGIESGSSRETKEHGREGGKEGTNQVGSCDLQQWMVKCRYSGILLMNIRERIRTRGRKLVKLGKTLQFTKSVCVGPIHKKLSDPNQLYLYWISTISSVLALLTLAVLAELPYVNLPAQTMLHIR